MKTEAYQRAFDKLFYCALREIQSLFPEYTYNSREEAVKVVIDTLEEFKDSLRVYRNPLKLIAITSDQLPKDSIDALGCTDCRDEIYFVIDNIAKYVWAYSFSKTQTMLFMFFIRIHEEQHIRDSFAGLYSAYSTEKIEIRANKVALAELVDFCDMYKKHM